jgi:cell wall-associated NlpC family hydrolase
MARGEADAHPQSARIIAEARRLVGVRFRSQGRDDGGLDCLGVIVLAARAAGIPIGDRRDYALRSNSALRIAMLAREQGLVELPPARAVPGDILIMEPADGQAHLGLLSDRGIIEAHAGIGRVVERPRRPDDRVVAALRLPGEVG